MAVHELILAAVVVAAMCLSLIMVVVVASRRTKQEKKSASARIQRSLSQPPQYAKKILGIVSNRDQIESAPVAPPPLPELTTMPKLNRSIGRYSVWTGIGLSGLTVVFLLLSVSTQYIVYEVDSVVSFVAALILFLRDPRARIQGNVLDAVLISSNRTMRELSGLEAEAFTYVPKGEGVSEVVVVPGIKPNHVTLGQRIEIIPPGRTLAEVFTREAGVAHPTLNEVRASLPSVLRDGLGLAESVAVEVRGDGVEVTMSGSSVSCGCKGVPGVRVRGAIGCTVASFLAVVISASTTRSVFLGECIRDDSAGVWKIPMVLERSSSGGEGA